MSFNKKIRSYSRELDDTSSLVVYRPVWTSQGLRARVSVETLDAANGGEDWSAPLGEITLSSLSERATLARTLEDMFWRKNDDNPTKFHWVLGSFFGEVIESERKQQEPVRLRDVACATADLSTTIAGWPLLRNHATILFGDGESAKSYLALYVAGCMARQGLRVLVCDWELSAVDHRARLQRLFGADMPDVHYLQCPLPLTEMVEHLQAYVEKEHIDYLIVDSIAMACSGPAETSEAATTYFAALRDIGVSGSLSIAHQTKQTRKADKGREKPFGSVFWHNLARSTWYMQATSKQPDTITANLVCRKANLDARSADLTVVTTFTNDTTSIAITPTTPPTVSERILALLKDAKGSLDRQALISKLPDVKRDTFTKTLNRLESNGEVVFEGALIALRNGQGADSGA